MRHWAVQILSSTALTLILSGCSSLPRFASNSDSGHGPNPSHQLSGIASYYAIEFNGRKTANGEIFNMNDLTAAHRTLPFNTKLKVRNLTNDQEVVVRINDRGPFKKDRVIDLSLEAARRIGLVSNGTAPVALEILEIGQP